LCSVRYSQAAGGQSASQAACGQSASQAAGGQSASQAAGGQAAQSAGGDQAAQSAGGQQAAGGSQAAGGQQAAEEPVKMMDKEPVAAPDYSKYEAEIDRLRRELELARAGSVRTEVKEVCGPNCGSNDLFPPNAKPGEYLSKWFAVKLLSVLK